ncbi:GNAT family N-acetyltransferase [Alicyclobacillus ferrooxydans]|uniref:N-acetyltransferase domain-containing protein n=1 Tax=Alicyclobacillus ferrooxydans TaxID=471514 RepID=A0A0P9ETZ3_9BACL|nr:GNAT family N-acetyltransferase [Alicyclobacillus ferrooxydans]KPV42385.1 hypothetical protein AN477_17395 [Alicyclobacillus ferrooxydans]
MDIVPYDQTRWEDLITFLKENWAPNHVVYDSTIFDWQYRCKDWNDDSHSLLVVDEKKILGFLGNIPGQYQFDGKTIYGDALTMWVVDESLRNRGLGVLLIRQTEKNVPVTLTLGCNQNVVSMYERMGYSVLSRLNRYVAPLSASEYRKLLIEPRQDVDIEIWANRVRNEACKTSPARPLEHINVTALERLFQSSIVGNFRFTQNRNANFWTWRYIENKGFSYIFFGSPTEEGIIVARVERAYAPAQLDVHGLKVLRLIELIPFHDRVWNGVRSDTFVHLIRSVLRWAIDEGCVAVDYQSSTSRLEHVLFDVGFTREDETTGLAQLFQPYRPKATPINFVWKVRGRDNKPIQLSPDETYFVKADCDMDRPNIWPTPTY